MSLFQGAFFIASLEFPGRVYNCKIFSGGTAMKYGNSKELKCLEIPGDPNKMSLFQGAFSSPPWNFQGGYTIVRYFPGGMAMK
jgi:hypothetical protein